MPLTPAIQFLAQLDRLLAEVDTDAIHPRDRMVLVLHLARELGMDDRHHDYDDSVQKSLHELILDEMSGWDYDARAAVLAEGV